MSEELEERRIENSLEWHLIEPKSTFYDEVEHRFFQNATSEKLLIGFGHNIRRLEIIGIAFEKDAVKNEDSNIKELKGEIIEVEE